MGEKTKSDLSRAFSEDGENKTHIGGQALLEGIMMRGKYNWAVAVREPDGNIYIEEHDLASGKKKHEWLLLPFIRGCTALVESMGLSFKALQIATEHAFDDEEGAEKTEDEISQMVGDFESQFDNPNEEVHSYVVKDCIAPDGAGIEVAPVGKDEPSNGLKAAHGECGDLLEQDKQDEQDDKKIQGKPSEQSKQDKPDGHDKHDKHDKNDKHDKHDKQKKQDGASKSESDDAGLSGGVMGVSMVIGVVLGIAVFLVLPAVITNLIVGEYDSNMILWNVVDGILRVAVFVFYIWLIGRMEDIRRMFMYHGAEHKTIHCYEHGLPLTPENTRSFPRLHVRCGTAFLIMVLVIAIIVYTIVPVNSLIDAWGVPDGLPKLALVVAVRIIFLPIIAGISYEITVRWAGSNPDNPLVKVILWPGMQMQYLTTNEPEDEQLECAIAAMKKVLEREEAEADMRAKAEVRVRKTA